MLNYKPLVCPCYSSAEKMETDPSHITLRVLAVANVHVKVVCSSNKQSHDCVQLLCVRCIFTLLVALFWPRRPLKGSHLNQKRRVVGWKTKTMSRKNRSKENCRDVCEFSVGSLRNKQQPTHKL